MTPEEKQAKKLAKQAERAEQKRQEEERQRQREIAKAEKDEMRNLINKWPKHAAQGIKVELDAEWKKAFVAMLSLALVNIDVVKKLQGLQAQISDEYNEAYKTGKKIEYTDQARAEIKLLFRIKNMLVSSSSVLEKPIPKLNAMVMEGKPNMDQGLVLYFVGAKNSLQGVLTEQKITAGSIDSTLAECFADAMKQGIDLEDIQKETLQGIDTKGDIERAITQIYGSVGLNLEG